MFLHALEVVRISQKTEKQDRIDGKVIEIRCPMIE